MASGTNAFPSRGGFNQSGGAHFMTLGALQTGTLAAPAAGAFLNVLSNPGSNSGGAFSNATLSTVTAESLFPGVAAATAVGYVAANKVLKDMGRTVVSAGRTFRKFAPVVAGLGVSSFGVAGAAASGPNAGFGAFYLEVGREGFAGVSPAGQPAPIVRYF
jgi:hypothetical protein